MRATWWRWLMVLVMAFSLVAAFKIAAGRVGLEKANNGVELAVEWREMDLIARSEGLPLVEVLRRFKEAGVGAVLFKESILNERTAVLLPVPAGEAKERFGIELRPGYTYLITYDQQVAREVYQQLEAKVPGVDGINGPVRGAYLIGSPLSVEELSKVGLGFDSRQLDLVASEGLHIIPQLRYWGTGGRGYEGVFSPLAEYPVSVVLFNDDTLPGYPGELQNVAEAVGNLGTPLGIIEFFDQRGLKSMVSMRDWQAVRVHSIGTLEIPDLTPGRAVDRYTLAATERDVRVLLVRMFLGSGQDSFLERNLGYVSQLKLRLQSKGLILGTPRSFDLISPGSVASLLMGLGLAAALALLLDLMGLVRWGAFLGAAWALLWIAAPVMGYGDRMDPIAAFGVASVFPALAVVAMQPRRPVPIHNALARWGGAVVISFAGAVLVAGLLTENPFLLNVRGFAGVKLAFLLPLALVAKTFYLGPRPVVWTERLSRLARMDIKVWMAALAVVLALVGLIYLLRSGNEGVAVSSMELRVRSLLERVLLIRPRTKEFLIGHPFLILSFWLGYRHRILPLVVMGTIGQVSLINTFAHLHTPFLVSLVRTGHGVWIGMLVGLAMVGLFWGLFRRWPEVKRLIHG